MPPTYTMTCTPARNSACKVRKIPATANSVAPTIQAHFEILRQLKCRSRTSIFAEPAKHATGNIERIGRQRLLPSRIPLPADFDTMFRASQSAKIARDTKRLTRFWIIVQLRGATESLGDLRPHLGILLGVIQGRALIRKRQEQPSDQVDQKDLFKKS